MDCHKCPYDGKRDPHCLRCGGPANCATSSHGKTFYSIEAMGDKGLQISGDAGKPTGRDVRVTDLPESVENTLLDFLFRLFSLSDGKLLLVKHVFAGGTLSSYADRAGITRQRVNAMAGDISRKVPQLSEMFGRSTDARTGERVGRFHQSEFYIGGEDGR